MSDVVHPRGAVVKGPDLFGPHQHRPYLRLSDDSHPFSDEEALYAAVTTTQRPAAISLSDDDFAAGGLPVTSYVNPWTVTSIRFADMGPCEGLLRETVTDKAARAAAGYLGMDSTTN